MSFTPSPRRRARSLQRHVGHRPQLISLEDRLPLGDSFISPVLGLALLGPSRTAPALVAQAPAGAPASMQSESPEADQGLQLTSSTPGHKHSASHSFTLEDQPEGPAESFRGLDILASESAGNPWSDRTALTALASTPPQLASLGEATIGSLGSVKGPPAAFSEKGVAGNAGPALKPSQAPTSAAVLLLDPILPPTGQKEGPPVGNQTQALPPDVSSARETYGRLPLSFEINIGQTDAQVDFLARAPGQTLFLTGTEAVLALSHPAVTKNGEADLVSTPAGRGTLAPDEPSSQALETSVVRIQFIGGNADPQAVGRDELPGKVNYFRGNDPGEWHTNIPTYARVEYPDVYNGIDLVYHSSQGQLEYDFIVAPGADPSAITLGFAGADQLEISPEGDLVLYTPGGQVRQQRPILYQELNGTRQAVSGNFVFRDTGHVGFEVGPYDVSQLLVIDPVLVYSTYLGGSGEEEGMDIAVDSGGNAYLTGLTRSINFPTTNPSQPMYGGGTSDVFVAKMNADGTALLYATYLGGGNVDEGLGIALDAGGNAYVSGYTRSTNFPTTPGAFDTTPNGSDDGFVTKLGPTGSTLVYSTYLGGTDFDQSEAVAVDAVGNAHVAGWTFSGDYPTQNPFQSSLRGRVDAAVTVLNATGTGLLYSTYLGSNNSRDEYAFAVAVDSAGNTYVTGYTDADNFPTTAGAFQTTMPGVNSAFVAKINPSLSGAASLVYSTYLGGRSNPEDLSGYDYGFGITVDAAGNAYVTGQAYSTDFPVTPGAVQPTRGGVPTVFNSDAFVTKLNPTGTALLYSTYLGGSMDDAGLGIALDASRNIYLTGFTLSPNFPTVVPLQSTPGGASDAFAVKLNADGVALAYSTYLGGSADDRGNAVAVDGAGDAYITGTTGSPDLPTSTPLQPALSGASDAFLAKVAALTVTSFTSTNTGFRAQFNQAINISLLNLYDTQTGGLGLPDVIVTGDLTGPVRGSLVVSAATNQITFIQTGGPLPADRYTVRLRSASNGFATGSGELLDGDSDGMPGGDYVTSFTIAPSAAVVVSVPDLTRGPGQPVNVPATTPGLPIVLSDGTGVVSVQLDLRYNPNLLRITGFTRGAGLPDGAQVTLDSTTTGVARLEITSATPLSTAPAELVRLTAEVPGTAGYTAKQILDLENIRINSGVIPAQDDDSIHIVAYFGDTSGNGSYGSLDATRVQRVAVGLDSGFSAYQLADPIVIADITGNGTLNATDATRVLQFSIGQSVPQVPALPDPLPSFPQAGPDPLLSIPQDLKGRPGRQVTVPVNLDPSDGLESVDLAIAYDTSRLEVVEVRRGELTQDFDLLAVNLDRQTGTIRVALARTAGPVTGRGSGRVLEIIFRVRADAPSGSAIINLRRELGPTITQLNEGGLDLNPDPSNEAGDALDGVVAIRRKIHRVDEFFRHYPDWPGDKPGR